MSEKHEEFIAEAFGGRKSRGSGSQWRDPADGRMDRRGDIICFAWDCKSTRHASITIKRVDLDKVTEQAHGDRPMLPLRFYDDDRLRGFEDWALVKVDDLGELIELAGRIKRLRTLMEHSSDLPLDYEEDMPGTNLAQAVEAVLRGDPVEVEAWVASGVRGRVVI
jgi:hypothetical protein